MENNSDSAFCSMYLQTIATEKKKFTSKTSSLDVSDIEGARPRFIEKPRQQRQIFYNRNDDIQKSHSRVIIPKKVNKPDRQLLVDDIYGTRTKLNKLVTTRTTNPLSPNYQLPQVVYIDPVEPKFIRDNMQVDDIEGTRTKETFVLKMQRAGKVLEKEPIVHDNKRMIKKSNNFMMDVSDINLKENRQKGNRCTNPLNPVYVVPTSTQPEPGWTRTCGDIEGSKPHKPKQNIHSPDFSLTTKDISGAVSKVGKFIESSKKQKIQGTAANSLKRGITSKRATNPLSPSYAYPGHSEMSKSNNWRPKTKVQRFDQFIF